MLKKNRFIEMCNVLTWNDFDQIGTLVELKMQLMSYPSMKTCVWVLKKNRFIETVLLSTHNICLVEK